MLKIFFVSILLLSNAFSSVVYVPCEFSIGMANVQLQTKIETTTAELNSKSSSIKNKYNDYNSKLEEYNERVQGTQALQADKNKLLLEIKNQLALIKKELYLGDDVEKNR